MSADRVTGVDRPSSVPTISSREHSDRGAGGLSPSRWLSIHGACAYLGVDQSTLRRWSDAGKVPVFRTPGGHRRYAEADLRALVGDGPRREERPRLNRQALTDRSLSGYEEEFLRAARDQRWFRAYSGETQQELRRLGRRLVDLAVQYVALAPMANDRAALLDEGRQIGQQYGRSGSEIGLSASESVEAFYYYRHPVVQAVIGIIDDQELATRRVIRLYAEIGYFLDQVLIATLRAHESAASAKRGHSPDAAIPTDASMMAAAHS